MAEDINQDNEIDPLAPRDVDRLDVDAAGTLLKWTIISYFLFGVTALARGYLGPTNYSEVKRPTFIEQPADPARNQTPTLDYKLE